MIKFGVLPANGGMALRTLLAARTLVNIIGGMTGHAARWCALIFTTQMAGIAAHVMVCVSQREAGFVVIKSSITPGCNAVASRALFPKLTLVCVVLAVTADAERAGFTEFLAGAMTRGACERDMRAFEREISVLMIEAGGIDVDDVGVTTTMLTVAGLALRHRNVRQAAMEPAVPDNVRGDVFVTTQTERRLFLAVTTIMAFGARRLELRMRIAELARRQQRLQRRGVSGARMAESGGEDQRHEYCKAPANPAHVSVRCDQ